MKNPIVTGFSRKGRDNWKVGITIPELEYKRVLACIGRLLKTNTGITAQTDKKILKKFL